MNAVQTTLSADAAAALAYLPHLAAGLAILAIGGLAAYVLGRAARALAARLGLDRLGERRGVSDDLHSIGVKATLSRILGRIVFLVVGIATLVQSVDALELTPLADALRALLGYTPRLILAIVILVLGAAIGDALAEAVTVSARRAGVMYDALLGGLVRGLILVLAVLMALQQLTIDATFLLDVLVLGLGGIVVALAIATGWGTRTILENIVAGRYVHQTMAVGDAIACGEIVGTIERIDIAHTAVRDRSGGTVVVPNAYFLSRTVRKTEPLEDASPGGAG